MEQERGGNQKRTTAEGTRNEETQSRAGRRAPNTLEKRRLEPKTKQAERPMPNHGSLGVQVSLSAQRATEF